MPGYATVRVGEAPSPPLGAHPPIGGPSARDAVPGPGPWGFAPGRSHGHASSHTPLISRGVRCLIIIGTEGSSLIVQVLPFNFR